MNNQIRTARNWLDLLLEKSLFRLVRGGKMEIIEPERRQQQQQRSIECANEKIEGEIISAAVKAEEEEVKVDLVLAKFGDLR